MRPIALVGFMGAGKSTIGRELADELGREFVDLDAEVSRLAGASIPDIFEQVGEAAFREREVRTLRELVADPRGLVIGCGGGVITTEAGRQALRAATVVYLAVSEKVLVERLSRSAHRPLLAGKKGPELAARIHELLLVRRPLYAQVADIAVNGAKPPHDVVRRIMRELEHEPVR